MEPEGAVEEQSRLKIIMRWIAVLPAAVLAYFLIQLAVGLSSYLRMGEGVDYWAQFINSIAGPYCLVWCGTKVAPSYKFETAMTLVVLHAIAGALLVTLLVVYQAASTGTIWWGIITGVIGIAASMVACLQFRYSDEGDSM